MMHDLSRLAALLFGCRKDSNNIAELHATYVALRWVAMHCDTHDSVTIEYDSSYAHGIANRVFHPSTNLNLVFNILTALTR